MTKPNSQINITMSDINNAIKRSHRVLTGNTLVRIGNPPGCVIELTREGENVWSVAVRKQDVRRAPC